MIALLQKCLLALFGRAPATGAEAPARNFEGSRYQSPPDSRLAAREAGAAAEDEALAHLQSAGLRLIQRNYLARGGELDLVMEDGNILLFVEVRFRAGAGHGDGLDSVSASKQRRLLKAARQFVADHRRYARWTTRFDVIALGAGGLRWVKNAIVIDQAGW